MTTTSNAITAAGIRKGELSSILYPDCQYVNPPGSLFCFSCNKALTKEALQAEAVEDFSKNVKPEMLQAALALFLQTKMMGPTM